MQKQIFATAVSPEAQGDEPAITISTIALDRDGDEIVPEGGDFSAYLRNPVVCYAHAYGYDSLPVGSTTRLDVTPGRGIRAQWRWLDGDPFASRVRNAFEQGVLRAASIGFLPTEYEANGQGGRRYTRWQLLEWSLCPIPSNPEAVRTLKRLGLERDDEPVLFLRDDDEPVRRKSGRVLSQANEQRVRDAQAACRKADSHLADVLASLPDGEPADNEPDDDGKVLQISDDFARELRASKRRRVGDPLADPSATYHHRGGEPTASVADVMAVLPMAVADMLRALVEEETQIALRKARGRVD